MHDGRSTPRVFFGWWVVVASGAIYATLLGSHNTFAVFFKPIQAEFGWGRGVTATAFLAAGLTVAALCTVIGTLSDRFGPRRVIMTIGLVNAAGYFFLSRVHAQWQLYASFMLEGAGVAFWVPLQAMISRWFTLRRGLALGLTGIGGGIGQALYPPFVQALIDRFGWRTAYVIMAAIVAAIVLAGFRLLGDPEERGLQPYGESRADAQGRLAKNEYAGAPSLTLKQALRTPVLWMILAATGFGSLTVQMVWVHLVPYVTDPGIGVTAAVGAGLLSIIGWSNIVGKVAFGGLSDRIGARSTLAICYGMGGVMMLWLMISKDLWMLYVFAVVFGFFYGGWIPMQPAIVGSLFGLTSMGAILGVVQTGTASSGAIGTVIGGYIYDVTGSYHIAFIMGAAMFLIAAALVAVVRRPGLGSVQGVRRGR